MDFKISNHDNCKKIGNTLTNRKLNFDKANAIDMLRVFKISKFYSESECDHTELTCFDWKIF